MSRLFSRDGRLVLAGLLVGICVTFSLGAAQQPEPRQYSVQYAGALLLITDHASNRMFTYINGPDGSMLQGSIDLTRAGEEKLVSEPPVRAVETPQN